MLIEDFGRNDADESSTYRISAGSVPVGEANGNDSQEQASSLPYQAAEQTYLESGALEYSGDQDWYHLPLSGVTTSGLKVLDIRFDDTGANPDFRYQISLTDAAGNVLLSHDYLGGSTAYQTEILAGDGDHYLLIQPAEGQLLTASAPYTLSVRVLDVDDPAEAAPGNDDINTAEALSPGPAWTSAKIAFRGDHDWYSLATDTAVNRVMEVFLDTDGQMSLADYAVSIMLDDQLHKIYDSNGSDGPTELKTSLYLPAANPSAPATYRGFGAF